VASIVATPTDTVTPVSEAASTATPTPTATPTWEPNPLDVAMAEANLALARTEATRVAAPPSATEVSRVCQHAEDLLRQLWRNQIARDMSKAAELAWEIIHIQEIDLDIMEGDIATAQAECTAISAKPHAADDYDLAVAQAELRVAEVSYVRTLASPTPEPPPTPTRTATPTSTATPTPTPTPVSTATPPQKDDTRIYSSVSGTILSVEIAGVQGNEATIEIAVLTDDRVQLATGGPPLGGPPSAPPVATNNAAGSSPSVTTNKDWTAAVVVKVSDGDTATFEVNGAKESTRLIGVDTPETVHPDKGVECYGPEAGDFTKSVLVPGSTVYLEFDAERRDRYDRLLAYVWLSDTQMLNMALVAQGYARPLAIRPNTRYARQFEQLAGEARREEMGLWGACP